MTQTILGSDEMKSWKKRVDYILKRRYNLTIELAGLSDRQIADYYQPDFTPSDFVEWFAEKYDLYDFKSY